MLHPVNPPSVYHMTKALDQVLLAYYAKNDGIRIADLLQGIVWVRGLPETSRDERLINRFDYDAVYGTVLNRFVLQATLGHPISVYGSGGQTRAFIDIGDAVSRVNAGEKLHRRAGAKIHHRGEHEGPRYRGPSCFRVSIWRGSFRRSVCPRPA